MNLALFMLLTILLVIAWQVFLEFYNFGIGRRFLGEAYRKRWSSEIETGEMPPSLRRHLIDVLYQHRFGWFLLAPAFLVGIFLIFVVPFVLTEIHVDHSSNAGGTIAVAVIGLPVFAFVWFIRAYERERELTREESDLWSNEFNEFIKAASDTNENNQVLQKIAIRQLQDFLCGAKWKTNRRSNNTAIFELFSSIVSSEKEKLNSAMSVEVVSESQADLFTRKSRTALIKDARRQPLILTISAVLQAVFGNRDGPECRVQVSQNSIEHMNFDFLTLDSVNFSGLKARHSSFDHAILWRMSLANTNLFSASFVGADLYKADLTGARLMWAKFTKADLTDAALNNANLRSANLSNAKLQKSMLVGANLTSAKLRRTILVQADLSDSTCEGVELDGADLSGAILVRTGLTKNVVTEKYKEVKYDENTKWDDSGLIGAGEVTPNSEP